MARGRYCVPAPSTDCVTCAEREKTLSHHADVASALLQDSVSKYLAYMHAVRAAARRTSSVHETEWELKKGDLVAMFTTRVASEVQLGIAPSLHVPATHSGKVPVTGWLAGWGMVHAPSAPCILTHYLGARAGAGAITFFYRILAQAAAPQKLEPRMANFCYFLQTFSK